MATLYVEEYGNIGAAATTIGPWMTSAQAPQEPSITGQAITISASSTAGAPFNAGTRMIRVNTDATCSIMIGANPTAVPTRKRMVANQTEFFGVQPGHTIAVITNV